MTGNPNPAYASMGSYLFDPHALITSLEDAHRHGGRDFGRDVLPGGEEGSYCAPLDGGKQTGMKREARKRDARTSQV